MAGGRFKSLVRFGRHETNYPSCYYQDDDLHRSVGLRHRVDDLVERKRTVLRVHLARRVRVDRQKIVRAIDLQRRKGRRRSSPQPELAPHHPRPVRETDECLWERATEFCAALDRYAGRALQMKSSRPMANRARA